MYEDRRSSRGLSYFDVDSTTEQSYFEVETAGPGVPPLDFPTPTVGLVEHQTQVAVFDHKSGRRMTARHILVPHHPNEQRRSRGPAKSFSEKPTHAYLTKKRLSISSIGQLRLCTVLRCRVAAGPISAHIWETTDELVVVKSSMRDPLRGLAILRKDAFCELAAQQHIGNYHPHCLGSMEAFQDDEFLYSVLPYCPGNDLYSKLVGRPSTQRENSDSQTCNNSDSHSISSATMPASALEESQAREWFCQLLEGIAHLQKKGVCHGDLCLENILVDRDGSLVLSDFGLSLRIPYDDESGNIGGTGITDVSEGSVRRLMRCLVSSSPDGKSPRTGGNPMYMAPELINMNPNTTEERVFDGFAVDLWSLGVVLCVMLTGSAPFRVAHDSDARFVQICKQGLLHKRPAFRNLSSGAVHLLQNMLWADPTRRLLLGDIITHRWVCPPGVASVNDSFDSVEDRIGHFASKKRLHHLSFFQLHSLGDHVVKAKCLQAPRSLEAPKVLQADERMASF